MINVDIVPINHIICITSHRKQVDFADYGDEKHWYFFEFGRERLTDNLVYDESFCSYKVVPSCDYMGMYVFEEFKELYEAMYSELLGYNSFHLLNVYVKSLPQEIKTVMRFQFEKPNEAMKFKLSWSGKL